MMCCLWRNKDRFFKISQTLILCFLVYYNILCVCELYYCLFYCGQLLEHDICLVVLFMCHCYLPVLLHF